MNSIRDNSPEIESVTDIRTEEHEKKRKKGQENSVQIIAGLVNPYNQEDGFENITLMNVCPEKCLSQ